MDERDIIIYSSICILSALALLRKRERRWSVRPINRRRNEEGAYTCLFKKMKTDDDEQFFKYTRMSRMLFDKLLNMMRDNLQKTAHNALTPEQKLVITLHYLSHGCSMQCVAWSYHIGKTTVHCVVREVCKVLEIKLKPLYLQEPSKLDLLDIAGEYNSKWNLPHCIGSIDGKHVNIRCPGKSGSIYFNYKKQFSVVLLAICDANYCFTYVDIGAPGSESDGGVFQRSAYGKRFLENKIELPDDDILPNSNNVMPYFLVGDEAFPLKSWLLRPYPGRHLPEEKLIFNYRLSRARRTIENAFGILTARWRILGSTLNASPDVAEEIIMAAVCLHNFLKKEEISLSFQNRKYCPPAYADYIDVDGNIHNGGFRNEISLNSVGRQGSNRSTTEIYKQRDTYAEYLCTAGAVPWQFNYVHRGINN